MKASVILPTFDHGDMIQFAIESLLRQTHQDFELFVIGDGAVAETDRIMDEYQKKDARVRYFKHPKDSRLGEIYRHPILMHEASGDFVCYLADDDLYLENHLELVAQELQRVDFTHTLPVKILSDGSYYVWQLNLEFDYYRQLLLNGENRTPLSMVAHTMKLYKSLPYGWRTTPQDVPTDLYMWQQILEQENVKASSLFVPSVLHFASSDRQGLDNRIRFMEIKNFYQQIKDPVELSKIKANINQAHQQAGVIFELKAQQNFMQCQAQQAKIFEAEIGKQQLALKHCQEDLIQVKSELVTITRQNELLGIDLQKCSDELNSINRSRAYRWAVKLREALKRFPMIKKILR